MELQSSKKMLTKMDIALSSFKITLEITNHQPPNEQN